MRPLFLALLSLSLVAQERPTILKAARLLDVRSGKIISPAQLWMKDGKIQSGAAPADADLIDLGDRTLLPGLIDCHTHLTGRAGQAEITQLKQSHADNVIAGVVNARKVLEAGFTTVRDAGSHTNFGDVALRDAIARGEVPGPRMIVAGPSLSVTGGHGDTNGFPNSIHFENENLVDSPEAARKIVREWRKRGVDTIKIHATGGVLSNHDDPGAPSFQMDEFKAIVEESTRRGMDVLAHAHGDKGILEATLAGVRSIEHGSLVSASTAQEMKKRGTYLVPTVYALESILLPGNPYKVPEGSLAKARVIMPLRKACFKGALDAGVKIAYGTDIGVFEHAQAAFDFRYMVSYGMTPLQAIQSATLNAAELLRLEKEVGNLESGMSADVIAVDGDPLKDIAQLEKVRFVMKGGKIFKKL
jgi:imidazolonepropionase-like amidohydrolase